MAEIKKVRATGLLGLGDVGDLQSGIVRSRLWHKRIKIGISFLKDAELIRLAVMGCGLQVHTDSEGW